MNWPARDLRAIQKDALERFVRPVRAGLDIDLLDVGVRKLFFVIHPDGVRHVLQENARRYTKKTPGFDVLRQLLGQGLLTSEGEHWLHQRRLIQPAFHRAQVASFGGAMVGAAEQLADEWLAEARGGPVDVAAGTARMALKVASRTLFGVDVADQADEIGVALARVLWHANDAMMHPLRAPRWMPTPDNRRSRAAREALDAVVWRIVGARRDRPDAHDDVLGLLLKARDDSGAPMSKQQLRDEILTLLLAGHETTANALSWSLVLLSRNPSARRRVEQEARSVLGDRQATADDAVQLGFTRRVIQEALRLYPPAWIFSRAASEPDEVCGVRIPEGGIVIVCPYATHRDPRFWDDPEGFDPDRFLEPPARFAYFPFGGGPRLCVGAGFAEQELVLTLATLARRVRLDLLPGEHVQPDQAVTLRPKGGLRMNARTV